MPRGKSVWPIVALAAACLATAGLVRAADETPGVVSGTGPAAGAGVAGEGAAASIDPARLGMAEGELRTILGTALKPEKIEPAVAPVTNFGVRKREGTGEGAGTARPSATKIDPFEGQIAFSREVGKGDVARAEYYLYRGKVYRMRWTLADRWKRPIMADLVALGTKRFGEPAFDQDIVWKPGDPRANLRRTAWERGGKSLEIRMLHPTTGGLTYLTVSDQKAIRAIVAAGGMVAPEPETEGSWWYASHPKPSVVTPEEKQGLLEAAGRLLGQTGF